VLSPEVEYKVVRGLAGELSRGLPVLLRRRSGLDNTDFEFIGYTDIKSPADAVVGTTFLFLYLATLVMPVLLVSPVDSFEYIEDNSLKSLETLTPKLGFDK
jgi:hypothetical protein